MHQSCTPARIASSLFVPLERQLHSCSSTTANSIGAQTSQTGCLGVGTWSGRGSSSSAEVLVCAGMSNCSARQKFLAKGHWKMICVAFSSVSTHTSQVASWTTCFFTRFARHCIRFWVRSQAKNCTRGSALFFRMNLEMEESVPCMVINSW
jgi:hypothetical protein